MDRRIIAAGSLAVLLVTTSTAADHPQWVGKTRLEIHQEDIKGGGNWKAHGQKKRSRQRWSLNLELEDDGRVSGQLDVENSELFSSGHVEGAIQGRRVVGTIFGERGDPVAAFNGIATPQGVSGSYIDRTGGTGEWDWDGPLPE